MKFKIGTEKTALLNKIALQRRTTLFTVLLAVYHVLLGRITHQEDIIIGTPVWGRTDEALKPIVGMFVNLLVMRNYPHAEKSFEDFLSEVNESTLNAFDNQDYQYDELVKNLGVIREINREPLAQTHFVFQNPDLRNDNTDSDSEGLKLFDMDDKYHLKKYQNPDIVLTVSQIRGSLFCQFAYKTQFFRRESIEKLGKFFDYIVENITENPGIKIGEIVFLSEQEKSRLASEIKRSEEFFNKFEEETFDEIF